MTAREILLDWAGYAERHLQDSKRDVAALRELDQLLLDAYKLVSLDKRDAQFRDGWISRAAQAGYGEK